MHLKSLTLKGFKSFPERTRLDFGAGVSVVVGPNGSGKSNVTDAVLWAMGEQSPLAVRGSSMQDVIFGGARGVKARSSAEVEIVLDNGDGTVEVPFSEISIVRRLERSGEGEYRLNGSRCRLGDVIEVLSDTGLGKETHSVISQGRVEAIVASKPRERRLMIEEAAGLGKHRKRRRRAQLKLGHTQENLDRALDIEREARTRLRPLKRQAEAAELHERLERQSLEARLELAADTLAQRRSQLAVAESEVAGARAARERIEAELEQVVHRRGEAERALAQRAEQREQLTRKAYGVRSAGELVAIRLELSRATTTTLSQRIDRGERELQGIQSALEQQETQRAHASVGERIAQLEAELAELERRREQMLEGELEGLRAAHAQADTHLDEVGERLASAQRALADAERDSEAARERHLACEREVEEARRGAARVGAELAAVNQFLRGHSHPPGHLGAGERPPRLLGEALQVKPGYELALTAALGRCLDAALVRDLSQAQALLDRAGPDGATALLAGEAANEEPTGPQSAKHTPDIGHTGAPVPGAIRLTELLGGSAAAIALAQRLLADAWVLERLEDLPDDFRGIAVTRGGRVLFAASGEVRQITEGGAERVLAQRNERERLIAESERAVSDEHRVQGAAEQALAEHERAERAREQAEQGKRQADREHAEAQEALRRAQWLIEQRQSMPDQGPEALRRAQIEGELAAERRQSQRITREAAERAERLESLGARLHADRALLPAAQRLVEVLEGLAQTLKDRGAELESKLSADRAAGEEMSGELRACAAQEAEIQARLRGEGERVTEVEVAAQRLRDQSSEARLELEGLAERLALEPPEPDRHERLSDEQREALNARVERLARRREQLGPVNPLAQEEYAQAVEHVEELEGRRSDLETALRELRTLIRDIDRQIHETFQETFQAAAANFAELVDDVFPGGSGKLTLVREEQTPRPVLGGEPLPEHAEEQDLDGEEDETQEEDELLGVEIEITPAGKSSKRLSLLSGGEKSMTALAFLFAVFLARPCPFYILDEVEAALDDLNLDRFLTLLRRYSDRAQFIVITHQKRTMEAADWLYGVSMGGDGISKVISRRLPPAEVPAPQQRPDLAPAVSA